MFLQNQVAACTPNFVYKWSQKYYINEERYTDTEGKYQDVVLVLLICLFMFLIFNVSVICLSCLLNLDNICLSSKYKQYTRGGGTSVSTEFHQLLIPEEGRQKG